MLRIMTTLMNEELMVERTPPTSTANTQASQNTTTEQKLVAQFEKLENQFALLKEQTRQAQTLASLGTAAAMLAHEFNNVMTPVISYARFAIDSDDKELMVKALNMTLKQAAIVSSMSDRILGLAVNEAQVLKPVNLSTTVEEAKLCMCRDLSKDSITLVNNIEPSLAVMADAKQLQQVFFNMLINARHAIDHRNGRIKISAEKTNNNTVAIHIADNGCGISQEHIDKIFNEFYSTKKNQPGKKGSGLGLSLCRDIVDEHNGSISVSSEVGKGTTFTIMLPAAT